MKRSKFSDSQIIDSVKRIEAGIGVPDICRELGISTATFLQMADSSTKCNVD
jgi:putative transposase